MRQQRMVASETCEPGVAQALIQQAACSSAGHTRHSPPCMCGQIDEKLMGELRDIKQAVQPTDTLLVVDAMTGQEAAGLVKSFNDAAELTGAAPAWPA